MLNFIHNINTVKVVKDSVNILKQSHGSPRLYIYCMYFTEVFGNCNTSKHGRLNQHSWLLGML